MENDRRAVAPGNGETTISPRGTLFVLLLTTAVLMLGAGLFNTLLGVRATLEAFSTGVIGLIMSAYFAGFACGAFLCVRIVREVGHIRAFAAFAAIFTTMALAHAIWVAPLPWLVFRFVAGIAVVGLALVIESWLNAQAASETRGRVFSIYMVVNLSAVALGQLLLTAANPAAFVLFAVAAILFSLSMVPTTLVRVSAPTPQEATGLSMREMARISPVGVAGCFASGVVGGAFWGMAPVFVTALGFQHGQVAAFMFVAILGGMLSQFPIGRYSDGHDRRKVIAAVTLLAAASAVAVLLATAAPFGAMAAAVFCFGAFMFPIYGLSVARAHDLLTPDQALAATRGLMLVFGLGAAVGPFAAGLFMGAIGPHALFGWFALVLAALGAYSGHRLRESRVVAPEAQSHFMPLHSTSHQALEMAEEGAYPDAAARRTDLERSGQPGQAGTAP